MGAHTTKKRCSLLCPTIVHPHKAIPEKRFRFDLTSEVTPEWWCITDSKEPPRNQAALPDKPLPTVTEEPQPEPAAHLPLMPNLPTLYAFLTKPLRKLPFNLSEASYTEPKVPPIPTLNILQTVTPRKQCMQTSKFLQKIRQPLDSWETYLVI